MKRREFLGYTAAGLALTAPGVSALASVGKPKELRVAEVLQFDCWKTCAFHELKRGDVFRLRDPRGPIADAGSEYEICIAVSDVNSEGLTAYVKADPWARFAKKIFADAGDWAAAGVTKAYLVTDKRMSHFHEVYFETTWTQIPAPEAARALQEKVMCSYPQTTGVRLLWSWGGLLDKPITRFLPKHGLDDESPMYVRVV